ncbi:uncharacterized protein ACBR49_009913 isoform 1-T1 [Aulostomus maculatus]
MLVNCCCHRCYAPARGPGSCFEKLVDVKVEEAEVSLQLASCCGSLLSVRLSFSAAEEDETLTERLKIERRSQQRRKSGLQMAALLSLVGLMMMMRNDASTAEHIPVLVHSGEATKLTSGLQEAGMEGKHDIRWTHRHLVLSLKKNLTTCHHRRCELQSDGSLKFSKVQSADAGNYSLEVFDNDGRRLLRRDFLLQLDGDSESSGNGSSSSLLSLLRCSPLLLFLMIIAFLILWNRRGQRKRTPGLMEDNVYVVMHGHLGNKRKEDKEEKQERDEDSIYVTCHPAGSREPQPLSVDREDV